MSLLGPVTAQPPVSKGTFVLMSLGPSEMEPSGNSMGEQHGKETAWRSLLIKPPVERSVESSLRDRQQAGCSAVLFIYLKNVDNKYHLQLLEYVIFFRFAYLIFAFTYFICIYTHVLSTCMWTYHMLACEVRRCHSCRWL